MKPVKTKLLRNVIAVLALAFSCALLSTSAVSGEYDNALKDVKSIKAVFDVTQGSPKTSNLIFWAVKNVYEDETVKGLPQKAELAIVFHGPAVKLISTDRSKFKEAEYAELDKFHGMIRQLKKDGVKLEVCVYALKVMGVDPATVYPEIDQVGNGFISVIGYQQQGYSVVRIP